MCGASAYLVVSAEWSGAMPERTIEASVFSSLSDALYWAPEWAPTVAVLVLATLLALVVHRIIVIALRRAFGERHPYLRSLLRRANGPLALALIAFALSMVLESSPFDPVVSTALARILLLAFIVLAGWIAHIAVETTSTLYLMRFETGSTDNLLARKHLTQVRILKRAVHTLIVVITLSAALMTFEPVRQYGVSLFASAGVAGLVVGLAARPVLSNLFAGIQLAMTQPVRLDDQVVVENENGRIEEITSTYVVIRLLDLRRLIVPLSYFIEKPFQNWSRESTNLIGAVLLHVDYTAPVERIRSKVTEIVNASKLWDGQVAKLQVTDAKESSVELRVLVSARSSGEVFDLRCEVREKLIDFLQRDYPTALPRTRQEVVAPDQQPMADGRPARTATR
jgi:small-conductance mechanosensitive channel